MDEVDLEPLLARLYGDISELEKTLRPLIDQSLSEQARQLPLLDRAKLYTLVVYAIESLLFCMFSIFQEAIIRADLALAYLRLQGVKATEHPIFRELTRVKQYFEKIKRAEFGPEKPNMQLDKAAADRFIKHALVGATLMSTMHALTGHRRAILSGMWLANKKRPVRRQFQRTTRHRGNASLRKQP